MFKNGKKRKVAGFQNCKQNYYEYFIIFKPHIIKSFLVKLTIIKAIYIN